MRLARFIAQTGVASRRRADELITGGLVSVNGQVVKTLGAKIEVGRDRVEVEGRRVSAMAQMNRLLLKPRACLATLDVVPGRPSLARYVRDPMPGMRVVAPLDFPAEGVVILTTDGDLAETLSRPGCRLPMTYHLKFQGPVVDTDVARLLRGWTFEGRRVTPAIAEVIASTGKNTWLQMVVPESRPRALKAGGEVIRRHLLKVSRVAIGPISFVGLKMGEARDLTAAEVVELRRLASGAARPAKPRRARATPARRPGGPARRRPAARAP